MNIFGKDEAPTLVLMSRDAGSINGIVKRLAGKHGLLWRELPDYPLARNAAIVLVAPAGDGKMFDVLSDRCGVWDKNDQSACAFYELEVGDGDRIAISGVESLSDWLFVEYYYYAQNEFGFEGADGLTGEQLQEFETVLERALMELIKSFDL